MAVLEVQSMVEAKAKAAKSAAQRLRVATEAEKNKALLGMAESLLAMETEILAENAKDMEQAQQAGLSSAMLDRLLLNSKRIHAMAQGLREVVSLPDPVGHVIDMKTRPNGLIIEKVRVPLGVIGIVYESRPNVTVDAASLCLKAGNAVILRGGSEALHSNIALGKAVQQGLKAAGLPEASVQVMESKDRAVVLEMLHRNKEIDVIIPRGGHDLIEFVLHNSSIPVIRHDIGNCHVYVDKAADLKMAEEIVYNAKVQRPGVCNAMEHLLVHKDIAEQFVPAMVSRLQAAKVEVRGDETVYKLAQGVKHATQEEWAEEYLDLICGIKVVEGLNQAIEHINTYGSQHSDSIITQDQESAERFLKEVDSAAVYHNASTRFTDGGQFGMGAEIGISTQKLHARGPMALEELTCGKYIVRGSGQIRS